ncbi:MAG: hypothetical protein DRI36_06770 [Caldiserica bacterium]|nr:MAG: hypothetical protein DRI36_06770 [Caldisericota bacterium]
MNEREYGKVIIYLENLRIEGKIYTRGEYVRGRITDALNDPKKRFIPVVEAKVYSIDKGELLYDVPFLILNTDYIVSVMPKFKEIKDE